MKTGKRIAALSALALACAPVVASATTLFSDDFDAGTSASRYDTYTLDRAATTDYRSIYNFDYGSYKYWHISADQSTQNQGDFIPQAPRSTGAAKVGLLLDANNVSDAATPNTAQIDIIPKISQYLGGQLPSGNYALTFDVFALYNGRFQGGGGSTEFITAGVNQPGGGIGGLLLTGTSPNSAGQSIAFSGDGQNGLDYRHYQGNNRFAELDAGAGFVAVDQGPTAPGPSGSENPYYAPLFPFTNPNNATDQWYETPGAIGKHWTTIQIKVEDGIVYTYAKPAGATDYTLIAARTDTTSTSGHISVGYADTINGTAQLEDGDGSLGVGGFGDANFAIFDNISVDTITQVRQKWNVATSGNWTDSTKWLASDDANGVAELADFTTALSSAVTVTVDSARTVRAIKFDSTSAGYTLAGSTITLDSLTDGIRTRVQAVTGNHTIAASVVSNKPITFDIATGSSVKLNDLSFNIVPNAAAETPTAMVVEKLGGGTAEVNRLMVTATTANVTVTAGVLKITANGGASGVSRINNLTISGGAKLDISDNHLITPVAVGSFNGTSYTGVSGLVASGRSGNTWTGSGIITSQSNAAGSNYTSIGVAKASDVLPATATATAVWAGQTITGTDTLVMYTYGGDANLDGKINIDDYVKIDQGIASQLTGWSNGDFNYDGKVNIDDYSTVIDQNIGTQNGVFFTGSGAGGSGVAAVPEPLAGSLLMIPALALLRRRRREEDQA